MTHLTSHDNEREELQNETAKPLGMTQKGELLPYQRCLSAKGLSKRNNSSTRTSGQAVSQLEDDGDLRRATKPGGAMNQTQAKNDDNKTNELGDDGLGDD